MEDAVADLRVASQSQEQAGDDHRTGKRGERDQQVAFGSRALDGGAHRVLVDTFHYQ
jgi:hypothetical protein